jgi:hypothetical protein
MFTYYGPFRPTQITGGTVMLPARIMPPRRLREHATQQPSTRQLPAFHVFPRVELILTTNRRSSFPWDMAETDEHA